MPILPLSTDELLTTTRAVRKRLDFDRPVGEDVLRECLEIALQAPTASNSQPWHFVVVRDAARKEAIAAHYRTSFASYATRTAGQEGRSSAIAESAAYLAERFGEVPAFVIPVLRGRPEALDIAGQASLYGSILQGTWSFQLAARSRGLGTCFTTLHLPFERETAAILGIPFERYAQVGLVTVGYTLGTDFKPAARRDLDKVVHWDAW
jgi:nitroreductase